MGVKITYKDPNAFTLDELGTLTSSTMHKIINQMSQEHKQELLAECEAKMSMAKKVGTAPGQFWSAPRGTSRFPSPYEIHSKYAYLYTCIAGYQTDADLTARAEEQFQKEGISDKQVKAMEAKGWIVKRKEVKK